MKWTVRSPQEVRIEDAKEEIARAEGALGILRELTPPSMMDAPPSKGELSSEEAIEWLKSILPSIDTEDDTNRGFNPTSSSFRETKA
jgi:hypothetical protein